MMINVEKNHLSAKLDNIFLQRGFQRKYEANEIIFMENDREDCLFYIGEGLVKLYMISQDGKEKTLHILPAGQMFGEIALFDGLDYCVNAQTLSASQIYSLSYKDITDIINEEPGIALELLKEMADKMRIFTQQIKDMVFYDISGRMASQLLLFIQQFGSQTERGIVIEVSLTHQELANLLGASRVTVTKTLNQFTEEGIIEVVNRRIVVIDPDKLCNYIR